MEIKAKLESELNEECRVLTTFLLAIHEIGELSPVSKDRIIGVGERLSTRYITALLQDRDVASQLVDLSSCIKSNATCDLGESFFRDLVKLIGEEIHLCGDRIPCVTGFFGWVSTSLQDSTC